MLLKARSPYSTNYVFRRSLLLTALSLELKKLDSNHILTSYHLYHEMVLPDKDSICCRLTQHEPWLAVQQILAGYDKYNTASSSLRPLPFPLGNILCLLSVRKITIQTRNCHFPISNISALSVVRATRVLHATSCYKHHAIAVQQAQRSKTTIRKTSPLFYYLQYVVVATVQSTSGVVPRGSSFEGHCHNSSCHLYRGRNE